MNRVLKQVLLSLFLMCFTLMANVTRAREVGYSVFFDGFPESKIVLEVQDESREYFYCKLEQCESLGVIPNVLFMVEQDEPSSIESLVSSGLGNLGGAIVFVTTVNAYLFFNHKLSKGLKSVNQDAVSQKEVSEIITWILGGATGYFLGSKTKDAIMNFLTPNEFSVYETELLKRTFLYLDDLIQRKGKVENSPVIFKQDLKNAITAFNYFLMRKNLNF